MFYLRSLTLLLFILCHQAYSFESGLIYEKSKRDFGSIDNRRFQETETLLVSFGDSFSFSNYELKSTVLVSSVDYSGYTVRSKAGIESALKDRRDSELFLDNTFLFYKDSNTFQLSLFSHLGESPFKKIGTKGVYSRKFRGGLEKLLIQVLYYKQTMPIDYFIDSSFQNIKRASTIYGYSFKLGGEAAVNDSSKVVGNFFVERKKGERPTHFGADLAYITGIKEDLFFHLNLGQTIENRGEHLIDERGYYSHFFSGGTLIWEPLFEVLVSIGYVFTRELEEDPRIGSELQTGSDTFQLGLDSSFYWGKLVISGSYTQTNRDEKLYGAECKVVWDI